MGEQNHQPGEGLEVPKFQQLVSHRTENQHHHKTGTWINDLQIHHNFLLNYKRYNIYLTSHLALEKWISILCHPIVWVKSCVIDRKIWKKEEIKNHYYTSHITSKGQIHIYRKIAADKKNNNIDIDGIELPYFKKAMLKKVED